MWLRWMDAGVRIQAAGVPEWRDHSGAIEQDSSDYSLDAFLRVRSPLPGKLAAATIDPWSSVAEARNIRRRVGFR